jgi:hypothetical protein
MSKRLLVLVVLLLAACPLVAQGPVRDTALVGTWVSGISANGGVQVLVVTFNLDGSFTRRFWFIDREGPTPTEQPVNGQWATGPSTLGDAVICTHNTARPVTVCNSYVVVDPDRWALGEIVFHRMTAAERNILKATKSGVGSVPGYTES